MKHSFYLFSIIFVMSLISCSSRESKADSGSYEIADVAKSTYSEQETSTNGNATPAEPVMEDIPKPIEQKLIKNGDLSFRVKSLGEMRRNLKSIVSNMSGYISKETTYGNGDSPSEEVIVRIPGKNFDKFMDEVLKGAEEVDSKNVDIEDVTEQFVDIEARLKNKKQLEQKYQELLAKATTMDNILKIEREISLIREDIEASEGRLRYLSSRVSYSTITLRFYEKRTTGFGFGGKVGKAAENGGIGVLWFIIALVNLWPLWIVGMILWYIIRRVIRKSRKAKNQGIQAEPIK